MPEDDFEHYVIREEAAFRRHLDARLTLVGHPLAYFKAMEPDLWPAVESLLQSAFKSGVAFGESEATHA